MLGILFASVVVTVTTPAVETQAGRTDATVDDREAASREALVDVLASCRTALGESECQGENASAAIWNAQVVFSSDGAQVTLNGPTRVVTRRLEFLPEDSPKQRRVAAGLLVAAMTAAARLSEPKPKVVKSPEPNVEVPFPSEPGLTGDEPTKVVDRPHVEKTNERSDAWSIEAAALVGPTLDLSHLGWGGRFEIDVPISPRWGGGASLSAMRASRDGWKSTSMQFCIGPWFSPVGANRPIGWKVTLEAVLDRTEIVHGPSEDPAQNALRAGGRLRTSFSLGDGRLTPLLGLGITALGPSLEVRIEGEPAFAVPAVTTMGYLGVGYRFLK